MDHNVLLELPPAIGDFSSEMFDFAPLTEPLDGLKLEYNPPSVSPSVTSEFPERSPLYGHFIDPDEFLNDVIKKDSDSDCSMSSNRDTPSPTGSKQSIDYNSSSSFPDNYHTASTNGSHGVPIFESPPVSPQNPTVLIAPSVVPTAEKVTSPADHLSLRKIKIQPQSTGSAIAKTITKKTIVLSAKDYTALLSKMKQQPSANTILLKATPARAVPLGPPAASQAAGSNPPVGPKFDKPVCPRPKPVTDISVGQATSIASDSVNAGALSVPLILASGTSIAEQTIDERTLKKHQRMIKNRESAFLSRVKKKEYITSLEQRIETLSKENQCLRKENSLLLETLQTRCSCGTTINSAIGGISKLQSPNIRKNTAIVLAMLFMVTLNFGPLGNMLARTDKVSIEMSSPRMRLPIRGLLWSNDTVEDDASGTINLNLTALDELSKSEAETYPECPFYVNQTENIRLASELRKWIGENGYKNLTDNRGTDISISSFTSMFALKDTLDSMYRQMKNIDSQMKRFHKRQKGSMAAKKSKSSHPRAVEVYQHNADKDADDLALYYPKISVKYAEFFEEIGRRDDTFYLVSFSGEHLLLPALAYNKTNRPKMSLMLPAAVMGNGTHSSDKITLMQIDCEVMNTSMIQIREKTIPGDLRPPPAPKAANNRGSYGRNSTGDRVQQNPNGSTVNIGERDARNGSASGTETNRKHGHNHAPVRPFFVERMNEHLKNEHRVN